MKQEAFPRIYTPETQPAPTQFVPQHCELPEPDPFDGMLLKPTRDVWEVIVMGEIGKILDEPTGRIAKIHALLRLVEREQTREISEER